MKILKKILSLLLLMASFTVFIGCKDDAQTPVEEKTYKVTYDLDGGAFQSDVSETYKDGKDYTLPRPEKDGFEFAGWKEIISDNELSNYEVTFLNNRDYKLKATWEKVYQSRVLTDMFTPLKRTYKDIVFKTYLDIEIKLDLYLPAMEEGKKYPVVFFFFGGGWFTGDKSDITYYNAVLKDLAGEGFIVVAPNYRLTGSKGSPHYPVQVEDCFDAVRYVVKYQNELHADVDNMGAFGHSAGGYFSLMSAFAQDHFKGDEDLAGYEFKMKYAIALSAPSVYEKEAITELSSIGKSMLKSFLGTDDLEKEEYASCFPSYYINENNPIIYLVHGTSDELVPLSQSQKFYEMAKNLGIDARLIEIEHATHTYGSADGYNVSSDYAKASKILRDFILSQK